VGKWETDHVELPDRKGARETSSERNRSRPNEPKSDEITMEISSVAGKWHAEMVY
jgi:hypothetical protein